MLVWCANVPDFATEEGLAATDQIFSCSFNPKDDSLRTLVHSVEMHKHTQTCYKGRENGSCRFGFPRPTSDETVFLGLDNNARFVLLKRDSNAVLVNNYNSTLLNIWEENMDIQQCGNVTAGHTVSLNVQVNASRGALGVEAPFGISCF